MAEPPDIKLDCANLNTTECILRAAAQILAEVKKNGDEFNWDPPTFAVTLIIGFVALFFAALTIGQGLVSAAPGKHCSKYALGPWSHFSERRFDWSEMRVQATAYTPIIRVEEILDYLFKYEWSTFKQQNEPSTERKWTEPVASVDWEKRQTDFEREYIDKQRDIFPRPKQHDQYFPATWLALLTSIGLDHPGLWSLKQTRTDYIPSDLVAAPAYACARDLVTLAAVAAFPARPRLVYQQNSSSSVLISVHGPGFDLDFRQHPAIGTHGVFQSFTERNRQQLSLRDYFRDHDEKIQIFLHAHGQLPQRWKLWRRLLGVYTARELTIPSGRPRETKREEVRTLELLRRSACKDSSDSNQHSCHGSFVSCPCWCSDRQPSLIEEISHKLRYRREANGMFWRGAPWVLLHGGDARRWPTLFPRRSFKFGARVRMLLALSRFWSLELNPLEHPGFEVDPFTHPSLGVTPSDLSTKWRVDTDSGSKSLSPQEANSETTDCHTPRAARKFCANPKIIEHCRRHSEAIEEDKVWTEWVENLGLVRPMLAREITTLDKYLEEIIDPGLLSCRILCLGLTAVLCAIALEQRVKLKSEIARNHIDVPWPRESTARFASGSENHLRFLSDSSRRRVTDLCDILRECISWYREDPMRRDDASGGDSVSGRHFPLLDSLERSRDMVEVHSIMAEQLQRVLKLWEVGVGGKFRYARTEVQHHVDDLLIYRAILISIMYHDATDNSDMSEDGAYTKIIPVL